MREYGPRDKSARFVARFNGWLILCVLAPLTLLFGVEYFFKSPSIGRLLMAIVPPLVIGASAVAAIRWGKGLC